MKKMVCVNCKKECKTFVEKGGKLFCCDECSKKYSDKHKPKVCEFC